MVCACACYHEQPPGGWNVKSQARLDSIFDVVIYHLRSHPHIIVCLQQAAVVSCQVCCFCDPASLHYPFWHECRALLMSTLGSILPPPLADSEYGPVYLRTCAALVSCHADAVSHMWTRAPGCAADKQHGLPRPCLLIHCILCLTRHTRGAWPCSVALGCASIQQLSLHTPHPEHLPV